MKRIAYLCADPGVPIFGCKGASVHVQEVVRAMGRLGASVELFAARTEGEAASDLRPLPLHALPVSPRGNPAEKEKSALAANASLRAALAASGPFDLIYERYSLWSFAGMEFAREQGIPGVLEVNAPLIDEQAVHRGLTDRAAAEAVAARAFAAARVIACVSEGVAEWVRTRGQDLSCKVHVVPNAVNPHRFGPHGAQRRPPVAGTFVIGFVGTLKPWHGLPALAEAFAQLHLRVSEARLLIVGDGPERETLVNVLKERGLLNAVHFAGAVDPEEIPGWLASMHVAVAPYPALENFYFSPLKMFEYLAAGLPTVASRVGQITELLRDGETALLVPPGDAKALGEALSRLRADEGLRVRLGNTGRAWVKRHHTWDAAVARLLHMTSH